jgi:uncharacterized glyoxalase superfamily protein PhnB
MRDAFEPAVFYRDPKAALAWLEEAFGFETSLLVTDQSGAVAHAEMSFCGASVGVGGEWSGPGLGGARLVSPASLAGAATQFIWVRVDGDLHAHCERARAAGARITQEPESQFYGDKTYRALDPEGHVWCFRQKERDVSIADMEAASQLKIEQRPGGGS